METDRSRSWYNQRNGEKFPYSQVRSRNWEVYTLMDQSI